MRILPSACFLVLAAVASPLTPAFAAQPFDGKWSVEVVTEKGACDPAYRWDLAVRDGHVVTTPDMPAQASGSVSPAGVVAVTFSRGGDSMTAKGTASGGWANGKWASPTLSCAGRWRAEKRG